MSKDASSYKRVVKSTTVFGGAQIINTILRVKLSALFFGVRAWV
jgi:hypothetical protein